MFAFSMKTYEGGVFHSSFLVKEEKFYCHFEYIRFLNDFIKYRRADMGIISISLEMQRNCDEIMHSQQKIDTCLLVKS